MRTGPEPLWRRYGVDVGVALALGVVAFLARRHGLPTDGLWLDDSITGAGVKMSPSDTLTVGADHPSFILGLMAWTQVFGGDAGLAWPALIAGTLGAPLLYLALRALGFERAICLLVGAVLVAASTDIVYSGRVRTYTIDVLIVLALTMALPRLAAMRWDWRVASAWVVAAVVVSAFSVFGLVAFAVAGAVLLLYANADLRMRLGTVSIQAAATIALLVAEGKTYNRAFQADVLNSKWDTFVDFHANPVTFANEILIHLRRVADVFTSASAPVAMVCALVAVAALVVAARGGPQALRARYLVALLGLAFVGSVLGRFPFGPAQLTPGSDGGRWSLWLIPVIAIGLAFALQALRRLLARRRALAVGFDAAACGAALAILITAGPALPYPFPGKEAAVRYVESQLGPDDVVILPSRSNWSFAAESDFESQVSTTPESTIGFQPAYSDPRIRYVGSETSGPPVEEAVGDARRVLVYYPEVPFSVEEGQARKALASSIAALGYTPEPPAGFGYSTIEVFERGQGGSSARLNLGVGELPEGWTGIAGGEASLTAAVLDCLGISDAPAVQGAFRASGPEGLVASSEGAAWPTAAPAAAALQALDGPRGTGCVGQQLQASFGALGSTAVVTVRAADPPRGIGPPAVAMRERIEDESSGAQPSDGILVFVARGRSLALLSVVRPPEGRFPRDLIERWSAGLTGPGT